MPKVARKIQHHAAVIFADVKGFSQLEKDGHTTFVGDCIDQFCKNFLTTENHIFASEAGDGLFICSTGIETGAELALKLRDYFRGINWRAKTFDHPMALRVGVHFTQLTCYQDPKTGKIARVSGKGIVPGARIEPVTIPGKVFCSSQFAEQLKERESECCIKTTLVDNMQLAKGWGAMDLYELLWETEFTAGEEASLNSQEKDEKEAISGEGILEDFVLTGNAEIAAKARKLVCYNQGAIIEHFYMTAEEHKALRIALAEDNADPTELMMAFNSNLDDRFTKALKENFRHTRSILELEKGRVLPRMCMKYNFATTPDNKQYVHTHALEHSDSSYYSGRTQCAVEDNTASIKVSCNHSEYLENNLPEAVIKRNYINPRLDPALAREYTPPVDEISFIPFGDKKPVDPAWITCWHQYENQYGELVYPPDNAAYKSTLVIPITLKNNDLSKDFWELFKTKAEGTNYWQLSDPHRKASLERQIFGYFCMDHTEIDYFSSFDIDLGYMIADFLSVYYLINQIFTTLSDTCKGILQHVDMITGE